MNHLQAIYVRFYENYYAYTGFIVCFFLVQLTFFIIRYFVASAFGCISAYLVLRLFTEMSVKPVFTIKTPTLLSLQYRKLFL
jgi:hypothetical protein